MDGTSIRTPARHPADRATALPRPADAWGERDLQARQFMCIEHAFRAHGGLLSGEELARRVRGRYEQPISTVARWIVSRSIMSFSWQTQTLVPSFQFGRPDMTLKSPVERVVCELQAVFDDWELVLWFAQPNAWLEDASPVDLLAEDEMAVLQAARADRFIAR
jgi:hypothetical protein